MSNMDSEYTEFAGDEVFIAETSQGTKLLVRKTYCGRPRMLEVIKPHGSEYEITLFTGKIKSSLNITKNQIDCFLKIKGQGVDIKHQKNPRLDETKARF